MMCTREGAFNEVHAADEGDWEAGAGQDKIRFGEANIMPFP